MTNLDDAVGELVNTQGAGGFRGYYNDQEATAERLDGGIYWSGDLGYRDEDGFVYLAGRTSDWLRVDGENLGAGHRRGDPDAAPGRQPGRRLRRSPTRTRATSSSPRWCCTTTTTSTPRSFEAFLDAQDDLSPKAWPRYVRIADRAAQHGHQQGPQA